MLAEHIVDLPAVAGPSAPNPAQVPPPRRVARSGTVRNPPAAATTPTATTTEHEPHNQNVPSSTLPLPGTTETEIEPVPQNTGDETTGKKRQGKKKTVTFAANPPKRTLRSVS